MPSSPPISTNSVRSPPSSPRIPTHRPAPRKEPPSNPPEPPLTLLHPVTSTQDPRPGAGADEGLGFSPTGRTRTRATFIEGSDDSPEQLKRWKNLVPRIGAGMWNDIRNRAPWYVSDWTDSWNYRVVPSTLVSCWSPKDIQTLILFPVCLLRQCPAWHCFLLRSDSMSETLYLGSD